MSELADDLQRYEDACLASDLRTALRLAEGLAERSAVTHHEALIRLARTHMLIGDGGKALFTLWQAADAGFQDVSVLREDGVFAHIRDEEAFKDVVRACWANGYLRMLEREERECFQMKSDVLLVLGFRPGERVADLGAGSGYFTIPIARAVAPDGVVWAVDIFQEMLDFIARRLTIDGPSNVRLFKASRDDLRLPEGDLDTILMSDVLHYIPNRLPLLRRLKEYLRPAGRMVVLDFTPKSMDERPWGPSPDQQISQETIEKEMLEAGMKLHIAYDFLPEQHFTVFVQDTQTDADR